MRVLALDTASYGCHAALLVDGVVVALRQEDMQRGQDARLLPLLQEVLQEGALDFAALDRIAVLRGPGSFTGLRVGLAAARGLGLALGKPVFGINRLVLYACALCAAAKPRGLLVVLDSRRAEPFAQFFPADGSSDAAGVLLPNALAALDRTDVAVCGDGCQAFAWQRATVLPLPAPEVVLAAKAAAAATDASAHQPVPLYLRAPDVSCGPQPALEEALWE
ncbi:MAG: tRNA (adenosine(37)-N6)-threonylcarbamoyltransferase complex dimerization subunit type 1 TsaB [Alphaproteobacteria bacterium]|nr:tRNA (adenosine(37)-N6)-threonylcarbamoyltransferase complex dimerization subunit type 1 TsaB [Alphaproteobacteria bacterium]